MTTAWFVFLALVVPNIAFALYFLMQKLGIIEKE